MAAMVALTMATTVAFMVAAAMMAAANNSRIHNGGNIINSRKERDSANR